MCRKEEETRRVREFGISLFTLSTVGSEECGYFTAPEDELTRPLFSPSSSTISTKKPRPTELTFASVIVYHLICLQPAASFGGSIIIAQNHRSIGSLAGRGRVTGASSGRRSR